MAAHLKWLLPVLWLISEAPSAPTPQERQICVPDVHKYCQASLNGGLGTVLACLKANRSQLSRGCASLLAQYGQ